jgi:hypothetical protein
MRASRVVALNSSAVILADSLARAERLQHSYHYRTRAVRNTVIVITMKKQPRNEGETLPALKRRKAPTNRAVKAHDNEWRNPPNEGKLVPVSGWRL